MSFVHNRWYVAGLASALARGKMAERTLLGEMVLLFRASNGEAKAISGRCPHRFAPLSMGALIDDEIQCGYHGLRFDAEGRCVHNPRGRGLLNDRLNIKSYLLIERHHFLWIWLGAPEDADDALIPDFSVLDRAPKHMVAQGYLHSNSGYEIVIDNLLDASHGDFVHKALLSTDGGFCRPPQVIQDGDCIGGLYAFSDKQAQAFFDRFLAKPGEPADQEHLFKWYPPSMVWISSRVSQRGQGVPLTSGFLHALTPETENSTHYWFYGVRDFADMGEEGAHVVSDALLTAFTNEDKPMLEAVSRSMAGREFWEMQPAILEGDKVAVMVRHRLRKMIEDEGRQAGGGTKE
jgi:phenylpropionate dioxygenase-like ring-hydroxylating dioxygenase large terminal subunit